MILKFYEKPATKSRDWDNKWVCMWIIRNYATEAEKHDYSLDLEPFLNKIPQVFLCQRNLEVVWLIDLFLVIYQPMDTLIIPVSVINSLFVWHCMWDALLKKHRKWPSFNADLWQILYLHSLADMFVDILGCFTILQERQEVWGLQTDDFFSTASLPYFL